MTHFYETLLTGLGGIAITMFLVAITFCFIGLIMLMSVKCYRWVTLRIQKALTRPKEEILKPSIVWKVFERGLSASKVAPRKAARK